MMIGYKLLTADGESLRTDGRIRYPLPRDGEPGEWIAVPGNGAYVAHTDDLMAGGAGPLAAELECDDEISDTTPPTGVRTWRRVRILRCGRPQDIIPPTLLRIVADDGEHVHTDDSPPTLYLAGVIRQTGGYCRLYGQAQAHGQTGGYCR